MKLFLIGATGKTGWEILKQALEKGHTVTALARNPGKIKYTHPALQVVKGNVLKPESFEGAVKGHDAVLSALGHKRFVIPTSILSEGTRNTIRAMEKHGVKRLICITSLGINDSIFRLGLYYTLFTIPVILLLYFLDKAKQEKLIFNSALDWTVVRPGQLTNRKGTRKYKHGLNAGHYLLTKMISRADVAHFMLSQLEDTTYVRRAVGITN